MSRPTPAQSSGGRSFGAVVPDGFEDWKPPSSPRAEPAPIRRARPKPGRAGATPVWGRIADSEIEEVAKQAAERRAARYAARQSFLGRHRVSAPRKPQALETLKEVGRGTKVTASVVVVVVLVALVLFALPWLKVQRVEVEGTSVVSKQQLLGEVGAERGQSTLLLDSGAMTRSLLAQPWVRAASVRVHWPDTLIISVSPLPPALIYQRGTNQQLVTVTGATLGAVALLPAKPLPLLVDQRALAPSKPGSVVLPSRLTAALAALARVFPATYGVGVTRYVITSIGALEIESSAGWTADLGLALTSSQIASIGPKLEELRALAAQVNLKSSGIKEIYLEDASQVAVSY
ncbi:MAG: FtsQ-type POTRA domain-containing protein [Candidatus Dormiibacterota bacterium]